MVASGGLPSRAKAAAKSIVGTDPVLVDLIHAIKNEITAQLNDVQIKVRMNAESAAEERAVLSLRIQSVRDETQAARTSLEDTIQRLAPSLKLKDLEDERARLSDINGEVAHFLNYTGSHAGPLADANLWINNPVVVEWRSGQATVGAVNERIVEIPFVLQALGSVPIGGTVLDIGGGESTLGLSLASLGYQTTVIEPQGYPFSHPNLEVLLHPLEELDPGRRFDSVVLLSTIEHFGIGHYAGGPEPDIDADQKAMAIVRKLLSRSGVLALTVPYGPASINDLERTYDRHGVTSLMDGWQIETISVARRTDRVTWVHVANELIDPQESGFVAMLTARPL